MEEIIELREELVNKSEYDKNNERVEELSDELLRRGEHLNHKHSRGGNYGFTAIIVAACFNQTTNLKTLLEKGANPLIRSNTVSE